MRTAARAMVAAMAAGAVAGSLPTPAPAAPPAPSVPAALATGESRGGAARWRLEGNQVTVRLRTPLLPAGRRSRGYVRFACGDAAVYGGSVDDVILAAQGRARPLLRRLAGKRTIRLTLTADVAAQTNWCGLRVGGANARSEVAVMKLRRGTPVRCVAADPTEVLAENDRVLVTSADRSGTFYRYAAMRGCLKPDGLWQELERGSSDRMMGSRWPVAFTVAGTWVAWLHPSIDDSRCELMRRDLAGGEVEAIVPPPAGFTGSCQTAFRLEPDGAISDVTVGEAAGWISHPSGG